MISTDLHKKYKRVVVWGLKNSGHTHGFIHSTFAKTLTKLKIPSVWTEDKLSEQEAVFPGCLVIAANVASEYLPILPGVDYCLHNIDRIDIEPKHKITLQVYTDDVLSNQLEKWSDCTYFDKQTRTLFQSWGTDLLRHEFMRPVTHTRRKFSFWVGTIWNGPFGNEPEIQQLRSILLRHSIRLLKSPQVKDFLAHLLIRSSAIAPAVAGSWQVSKNYLPCRMFKHISYGQVGISNVTKFDEILGDAAVPGKDLSSKIDFVLGLSSPQLRTLIEGQQERISLHTYEHKLLNIVRAFEG